MILNREEVLKSGKEYKFRTAPIDPNDPFRGKYITLDFKENIAKIDSTTQWARDEDIYVTFKTDYDGYANIHSVSKEKPTDNQDFLRAKVDYIMYDDSSKIVIQYPFDRYYMAESKAHKAEIIYLESIRDTTQVTYALVNIKNGDAVLKDVLINGVPIKELINKE